MLLGLLKNIKGCGVYKEELRPRGVEVSESQTPTELWVLRFSPRKAGVIVAFLKINVKQFVIKVSRAFASLFVF